MRYLILLVAMLIAFATGAEAGPAGDALTRHLYAGTLNAGDAELEQMTGAEAQAARGMLGFASSIERLGQALHRHGLETPESRMLLTLPILRLPVPPNATPEPLDYRKFRAILQNLVMDMDKAEAALAEAGAGEVKFPIDLLKIRLDLDGDGKPSDHETLGGMMQALMRQQGPLPADVQIAFDTADIYWLRGYMRFITAAAQFGLAHDFQASFDKTFHVFFPRAGLPLAKDLLRPLTSNLFSEGAIGDAIAFIHLINWPVVEPERLNDARLRLLAMANLSRQSWTAARAETDNDREWLPNPKQAGAMAPLAVTDATIDGWLSVMAEFEAVLEGKKLIPHWRFDRGLNVKRMFTESQNFDLVLLITGTDAAPWLETGPISSSADWDQLMRVFQGNFLGYAVWFN